MNSKGFTIIELIFVIGILVFVVAGFLVSYVNCLTLNEYNLRFSIAMNLARQLMESFYYHTADWDWIHNYSLTQGAGFLDPSGNSLLNIPNNYSAAVYVDFPNQINPSIKKITIVICWRGKGARIIGEDSNLNGIKDNGEDRNGDNRLNSPCEITSAVIKK